jgi:hypothetical protein
MSHRPRAYQINRLATAREVLLTVVEIDDRFVPAESAAACAWRYRNISIRKSFGGAAHALLAASGKPGSRFGRNTREDGRLLGVGAARELQTIRRDRPRDDHCRPPFSLQQDRLSDLFVTELNMRR